MKDFESTAQSKQKWQQLPDQPCWYKADSSFLLVLSPNKWAAEWLGKVSFGRSSNLEIGATSRHFSVQCFRCENLFSQHLKTQDNFLLVFYTVLKRVKMPKWDFRCFSVWLHKPITFSAERWSLSIKIGTDTGAVTF